LKFIVEVIRQSPKSSEIAKSAFSIALKSNNLAQRGSGITTSSASSFAMSDEISEKYSTSEESDKSITNSSTSSLKLQNMDYLNPNTAQSKSMLTV
jgi:hypothetical protein